MSTPAPPIAPPPTPEAPFAAITADNIVDAFTAWYRDYRANPDGFMSREQSDAETPEESGVRSAEIFIEYLHKAAAVAGLFLVMLFAGAGTASAQDTVIPVGSSLSLAWDKGDPAAVPPEEKYKVRLLSTPTPNSVRVVEFITPDATTTYQVPHTALPDTIRFYAAVRALRVVNDPGESADSNVIGPFVKGTTVPNPRTLRGTVVPTTP